MWRPVELTHAVCGPDTESLPRMLENDGVLVTEAAGDRICILVVRAVYLWVTVGISNDPSQPPYPLGSAKVETPVALIRPFADAVPESLVATLDGFMPHPEIASYYIATEDLAEVLLVGTPIPSEVSKVLKGRWFRRWHASTCWLWTAATLVDSFMAPIEGPSRHGIEGSGWMLVGGRLGEVQNDFVPSIP